MSSTLKGRFAPVHDSIRHQQRGDLGLVGIGRDRE